MKRFWLLRGIKIALFVAVVILAVGYVVMSLWNCLIPALFGGPVISFFQALGLLILSKILFGGFHKKGGDHCPNCQGKRWGGWGKHKGDWRQHLKEKMESKMSSMTPEEKEKFKKKFGNRCGIFGNETSENENTNKE